MPREQGAGATLEELVEAFVARRRNGECVDVDDFVRAHPGNEAELRRLLSALLALERFRPNVTTQLERLGDFRIVREIGRGGMGIVYEAVQEPLGRRIALKLLPAHRLANESDVKRFRREAETASRLDHPGICTVYDAGVLDGVPFIAMRLVDGETLAQGLERGRASTAARPPVVDLALPEDAPSARAGARATIERVVRLFASIARTLHAAHEHGIVHRDVKPGNVVVTREGEPVVLDFGLAREVEEHGTGVTASGDLVGTPSYMAPEQVSGKKDAIDRRTDLFALGVALYECLTLKKPFDAPSRPALYRAILFDEPSDPRGTNAAIDGDLAAVIAKCLEKERSHRYGTAAELADDLERWLDGRPVLARPIGRVERTLRRMRRRPALSAAILAAVCGVLGATALFVWQRRTADQQLVAERDRTSAQEQRAKQNLLKARQVADVFISGSTMNLLAGLPDTAPVQREMLEQALAFYRSYLAENRNDPAVSYSVASAHRQVGGLLQQLGNHAESRAAYGESVALLEQLAREHRDKSELLYELGMGRFLLATALERLGEFQAAEAQLRTAAENFDAIRKPYPREVEWRMSRAAVQRDLGSLLLKVGRAHEAERCLLEAVELQRDLSVEFSSQASFRQALAMSSAELAHLELETGRFDDAECNARAAVEAMEWVSAEEPDNADRREHLAHKRELLGNVLLTKGELDEAEVVYHAAIAGQTGLAQEFPNRPNLDHGLGLMLSNLGALYWSRGETEPARTSWVRALETNQRLAARAELTPPQQRELMRTHTDLGLALAREDPVPAEHHLRRALELGTVLHERYPEVIAYRETLAHVRGTLGMLLAVTGRVAEAEPEFRVEVEMLREVVAREPRTPDFRSYLGLALHNLANSLRDQGKLYDVRALREEGFARQLEALRALPASPMYRSVAPDQFKELAEALVDERDHQRAAALARTWSGALSDEPLAARGAATLLARCVLLAEGDEKLEASRRPALAETYAREAVEMLARSLARYSASAKAPEARAMLEDTELGPLRVREDFQALRVK